MTIKSRLAYKPKKLACTFALILMMMVTSCAVQGVTPDSETNEEYTELVDITFEGGTGKAYVLSPVEVTKKGGKSYAKLVWSSMNYDYVIAYGVKYENENPGGKSTFTVPVDNFDEPLEIIADTVAMSVPHEISYRIIWNRDEADKGNGEPEEAGDKAQFGIRPENADKIMIGGMYPTGRMELSAAEGFDVFSYGTLRLIRIYGTGDYLLIPEGEDVPEDVPDGVTLLIEPLDKTYLVSTSAMDLVRQAGALDHIRFSGLDAKDWHIDEAAELMNEGKVLYAGKYRAPDYELILAEGCDLAVENTMIYHDPEVKEKLEELGIPVIVETSSYENDPLGRLEWIKLYGVLFGNEAQTDEFFDAEAGRIRDMVSSAPAKSVAFFYVTANGTINVRAPGDYITKMIEMAGGEYIPERSDAGAGSGMGTVSMQMEDFYAKASSADILIYNSTIGGEIGSVSDLAGKNPVFTDFKAVKEGRVYCLSDDFFQRTTGMADFIGDMHDIIEGEEGPYRFFEKLDQ